MIVGGCGALSNGRFTAGDVDAAAPPASDKDTPATPSAGRLFRRFRCEVFLVWAMSAFLCCETMNGEALTISFLEHVAQINARLFNARGIKTCGQSLAEL